jgi:antitoxin component of MazEF toxin-antitoxin module
MQGIKGGRVRVLSMGERTSVARAAPKTESLRTTIPMSVVKQLKLKEKDKLDWEFRVLDGKLVIVISKAE